jgi:hypothetical protein
MFQEVIQKDPSFFVDSSRRREAFKLFAGDFYKKVFLPKALAGEVKDHDDLYDALANYRRAVNSELSMPLVWVFTADKMFSALKSCRFGQAPLDFFETDLVFNLATKAVVENKRLFQEPTCYQTAQSVLLHRQIREKALKFRQKAELVKQEVGLIRV